MVLGEPPGPAELELEELYRRYAPRLRAFCARRLGDAARAEDACHEALLKAHAAADRFRDGAAVWPWLVAIARNVCTDMERRQGRMDLTPDPPELVGTSDPPAEAGHRSRRKLLADALGSLPLPLRRVVFLRHFAGLTYAEIAEHEGTTPGAVRSRILRARRMLRSRIEELATARGEWPLPAAAPWVRDRVTRARLAFGRVDAALGRSVESAVPYAAALLFAIGVTTSSGSSIGGGAASPARVAVSERTDGVRAEVRQPRAADALATGSWAAAPAVAAVAPLARHYTYVVDPKKVDASQTIAGQEIPIYTEIAFQCTGGTNEPGPVTKLVCETFPDGIKP